MELLIVVVLTLTCAQGNELKGPQNTLNVFGSTVTLRCVSPSRNCSGIDWQKYVSGANPAIFKGPSTILNTTVIDRDRYSVDNSSGCDLVIRNVQMKDAGRFICSAIFSSSQTTKSAYLIILETHPKCTLNASENKTVEGDGVQLNCEVSYNGTNRASMNWKGVTDAPDAVKNGNTISRSYSVVASAPEVPSFTCETSFAFETVDKDAPIAGLATNRIPNAICSTSSIKVLYSVRDVILSPMLSNYQPGTVITCVARGHPSPIVKWQEMENSETWIDIQYGAKLTMTDVPSKRYRCVAMNVVRGKSYNATSIDIQFDNTDPVSDVILTPSLSNYPPGTIITCAAKGHPSPTFIWQEMENSETWIDIQYGSKFTMTDVPSKRYRCVAMNGVKGKGYNATSHEIMVNDTDRLGIGLGIGIGIGLLVAILLGTVVFTILVKFRCLEVHPMPANKSPDDISQHQDHELSPPHQRSATNRSIPRTGAPLAGEQESAYASLGEDRVANEYASLEQRQKAKPTKKTRP